MDDASADRPLVLYDGTCGVCNRAVQLIIRHDRPGRFRFAALQSDLGRALLERHGLPSDRVDTLVLVEDGRAFTRSAGALRIARGMDAPWPALAVLSVVPRPLRDGAYDLFARHRYRVFGRTDACMLPPPEVRARFLS